MTIAIKFGNWLLTAIPSGWEAVPELGLRRGDKDSFPSNLVLTEEKMAGGMTLLSYVKDQQQIMERLLPQPVIVGPVQFLLRGEDTGQEISVSYKSNEQRLVVQSQIYVSAYDLVGIATFTTVQEELAQVRETFRTLREALSFADGS
jgi:hypothetical protein